VGISIELCLKSNELQSIRKKENVQCDIKFELIENKLKTIENIQFKVKLYREKKMRHFSYTNEYPYPPANSVGWTRHESWLINTCTDCSAKKGKNLRKIILNHFEYDNMAGCGPLLRYFVVVMKKQRSPFYENKGFYCQSLG
jgi:hypothetical protein